jgi:hypothetical protein
MYQNSRIVALLTTHEALADWVAPYEAVTKNLPAYLPIKPINVIVQALSSSRQLATRLAEVLALLCNLPTAAEFHTPRHA